MMVTVKVNDLEGVALDWVIAKCEGLPIKEDPMGFKKDFPDCDQTGFWVWDDLPAGRMMLIGDGYSPSVSWQQGGEIIDREGISIRGPSSQANDLRIWGASLRDGKIQQEGSSLLVAGLRAYVESVCGDQVDIPDNLA